MTLVYTTEAPVVAPPVQIGPALWLEGADLVVGVDVSSPIRRKAARPGDRHLARQQRDWVRLCARRGVAPDALLELDGAGGRLSVWRVNSTSGRWHLAADDGHDLFVIDPAESLWQTLALFLGRPVSAH